MPFFGVPIRNGLPIGLGSVAGFGVQQFDPSLLFEGGTVPGAWYDPSDLSTMFTTSAGTTPVAMPGQGTPVSVGLMLDKSQGLVGPELWADQTPTVADFGGSSGSYNAATNTMSNLATGTDNGYPRFSFNLGLVTGSKYLIKGVLSGDLSALSTAGGITGIRLALSGTANNVSINLGTGEFSAYQVANGAFLQFLLDGTLTAPKAITIESISVRELPGNHAIAINDTTARPELRARVNELLSTEDLTTANWTPTGVASRTSSASTATLPTGQNISLTRVVEDSGNTAHRVASAPTISVISGITYTASVVIKGGGVRNWLYLRVEDAASNFLWFNATTGATGTVSAGLSNVSVVSLGGGAWLASCDRVVSGSNLQILVGHATADNAPVYTGNGSAWFESGGADLRPANIGANVPAYQRIADANTYDTNGFPLYLRFDGIDDGMYTPANLNLSATDKVGVFAGVRKLSDAAQDVVAELSATIASNNGTFLLAAPDGATQTYGWDSKGTTQVDAVATGFAAPITNVVTGTADIAGDSCIIRVNGTTADTETGDQGTGNYGTYPLYIGSRGSSSLWFNGRLHGLIIAGSAVSAGNISATESWMAGKTGIQI